MAKEAEGEGEVGSVNGEGRWKKEREAGAAAWAGGRKGIRKHGGVWPAVVLKR